MRDGRTRKLEAPGPEDGFRAFLHKFRASIVVVSGCAEGTEIVLSQRSVRLGRGPGVDAAFDNPTLSREHAALEFVDGRFRLRDLDSTNGVQIDGRRVRSADLEHGDRFTLGDQGFQLVIEERDVTPPTWVLPER